MATSVVPALIDAMVSTFTSAITGATVYDGTGTSDDPGDYLMIGVDDPDSPSPAVSADVQQQWANVNYLARDEVGEITCAALSWNGDGNTKAARDAVYAILAAVENALRSNPSLGLANLLWTSFGTSQQLTQLQSDSGAMALVIFRVHFEARI